MTTLQINPEVIKRKVTEVEPKLLQLFDGALARRSAEGLQPPPKNASADEIESYLELTRSRAKILGWNMHLSCSKEENDVWYFQLSVSPVDKTVSVTEESIITVCMCAQLLGAAGVPRHGQFAKHWHWPVGRDLKDPERN
jgi:hypothetical protein